MSNYPSDDQLEQAIKQGKDLAGAPPAREASITIQTPDAGYLARFDLDDDAKRAEAIDGAKAFLDEL